MSDSKVEGFKKAWGPLLWTVAKYVAIAALGALATWLGVPPEKIEIPVEKTIVVEKIVEVPVVNGVEGRFQPGKRLFAAVVRKRAASVLTKDGFLLVGGDPTPLSKEKAQELLETLDDDTIVAAAKASGVVQDNRFLDRLDLVLQWLFDHKDQIAALVKWLLMLLSVI